MGATRWTLVTIARAGLLTALIDGAFSSVLSVAFYHSTVTRLFQGVAATLLGPDALAGGPRTALIGVLMHTGSWGTCSLLAYRLSPRSAHSARCCRAGLPSNVYGTPHLQDHIRGRSTHPARHGHAR